MLIFFLIFELLSSLCFDYIDLLPPSPAIGMFRSALLGMYAYDWKRKFYIYYILKIFMTFLRCFLLLISLDDNRLFRIFQLLVTSYTLFTTENCVLLELLVTNFFNFNYLVRFIQLHAPTY